MARPIRQPLLPPATGNPIYQDRPIPYNVSRHPEPSYAPQRQMPKPYETAYYEPPAPTWAPGPTPGPSQYPNPTPGNQSHYSSPTSGTQYSKELTQLDKIYKSEDKFSGTGDNFAFKLTIYYNKCRLVGLPPEAYIQGASIMLSGQAQNHYYANRGDAASFEEFCRKMQLFFEGPEWQRLNLAKWQTVSLNDTIAANPTLNTAECLRKMYTEIDTIQRGIDPAYHGPVHLRENIIRACRGHPALAAGLTNPVSDTSGLVNNLYASIINYEAVHKPTSTSGYVQSYNEGDDEAEAYFTDRRYRGPGRGRDWFKPYLSGGPTPSRQFGVPSSGGFSRLKKCFICGKEGCWSSNHTQQERDDSKKRFANRFPQYKNRSGYDQYLQQYIAHCEGDEDENNVAYFFDNLSIDSINDPMPASEAAENELFLTSIGRIKIPESEQTTNLLADNSFKHRITSTDETITSIAPIPYTFNTSSNSRYDKS